MFSNGIDCVHSVLNTGFDSEICLFTAGIGCEHSLFTLGKKDSIAIMIFKQFFTPL